MIEKTISKFLFAFAVRQQRQNKKFKKASKYFPDQRKDARKREFQTD